MYFTFFGTFLAMQSSRIKQSPTTIETHVSFNLNTHVYRHSSLWTRSVCVFGQLYFRFLLSREQSKGLGLLYIMLVGLMLVPLAKDDRVTLPPSLFREQTKTNSRFLNEHVDTMGLFQRLL